MRPIWWFVLFYTPTSEYFSPFSDLHKFFGQKIFDLLAVIFDQKADLLCHRKTFWTQVRRLNRDRLIT